MIKHVDYFVPPDQLSVDLIFDCAEKQGRLPKAFKTGQEGSDFFKSVIGLHNVAHSKALTPVDMVSSLLSNFFNLEIASRESIDLLVFVDEKMRQDHGNENIGHFLQYSFALFNADVLVLSGNHCANLEYAIAFCESLIVAGSFKNILIVDANVHMDEPGRIVGTYAVHGDGAGLIYLTKGSKDGVHIVGKHSYTNGLLHKADLDENNALILCKNYLACLSKFVSKFRLTNTDISKILIQNANHLLVAQCVASVGFDAQKLFLENVARFGHLNSIDFVVNLKSLMQQKLSVPRLFSFGTGWAGSNICLLMEMA